MDLDQPSIEFTPVPDPRPHMPEPPPVRLAAVEDVHMSAPAGMERELDDLYVSLLHFERDGADAGHIRYKAEKFHLVCDVVEAPIDRHDFRPIQIDVPNLCAAEQGLIDREIEYERHRGLNSGQTCLLFQDPAGNWVQLGEFRVTGI